MTNDSLLEKYVAGELTDEEKQLFEERQAADAAFASEVASLGALQQALDDSSSLSEEEEHSLGRTHAAILALMSAGAVGTATTVATVGEKAVTSGGGFIQGLGMSVTQFSLAVVGVATAVGVFTMSLLTTDKDSSSENRSQSSAPPAAVTPVQQPPQTQEQQIASENQSTQQVEKNTEQASDGNNTSVKENPIADSKSLNSTKNTSPTSVVAKNSLPSGKSTVDSKFNNDDKELQASLTRFEQRYQIYKERHDLQGQANILREIIRLHLALGDNSNAWKQAELLLPLLPTVSDDKSRAQGWLAIAQAAVASKQSAAAIREYCKSAELCFLDSSTIPTDIKNALDSIRKKLR